MFFEKFENKISQSWNATPSSVMHVLRIQLFKTSVQAKSISIIIHFKQMFPARHAAPFTRI